jgi:hypothetical protein
MGLLHWTHLARARFEVPRHNNQLLPDSAISLLEGLVTALRILQPGHITAPLYWQEPDQREFLPGGLWGPLQEVPRLLYSTDYVFTEDRILPLRQLSERLCVLSESSVQLALRRFDMAYGRQASEDKCLDLWIALEALFVPDQGGDLTFRLSTRIARFLETVPDRRRDLAQGLRKLYGLRSRVVHGNVSTRDLPTQVAEIEDIVRRSLARFLDPAIEHDHNALDFD